MKNTKNEDKEIETRKRTKKLKKNTKFYNIFEL